MKRIYTTAALLMALVTGASAQSIDLAALPIIDTNYHMPPTGQPFSLAGIFDTETPGGDSISAAILFTIAPGSSFIEGDQAWFIAPSAVLTADGVNGWLYTAPENIVPEDVPLAFTIDGTQISDSIHTLLNIENFEADSTFFVDLLVKREDLVVGNTYGWYGYIRPYPDGAYPDSVGNNNFRYVPIIWGGEGTSISDLLNKTKLTPLEIFPNPTTDNISFKLEFTKANKSTIARVLDISGRVVSTENFGSTNSGTQKHSVNVSKLPAGVYSLQVITDHTISVEKFVKK